MIKKVTAMVLVVLFAFFMVSCDNEKEVNPTSSPTEAKNEISIGVMLISNVNDYTSIEHVSAIKSAIKELSISEKQVNWKYSVKADESCYDTAKLLVDEGCDVVVSNSARHQEYMLKAANEFSDTHFVVIGGDTAIANDMDNFHNAYTDIYQARYLSGVVAGLKIKELIKNDKLKESHFDADNKVKVGYIGALPSSEACSSYTAFYLGMKSVHKDVSMCVQFTNKRSDTNAEIETTKQLIDQGCVIIAQHNSSTNIANAVLQEHKNGKVCYFVGYNTDVLDKADESTLVSSKNNWDVYYKELFSKVSNDEYIKPDWVGGLEKEAVGITKLSKNCTEDAQAEVDLIAQQIVSGEVKVFDVNTFTVGSKRVKSAFATDTDDDDIPDKDQAIFDGAFNESYFRSAPYFLLDIDGISVLN